MGITSIQWTDFSWNPIIGCHKISPGCDNCYAEKMGNRIAHISSPVGERYSEVVTNGTWNSQTNCDYDIMQQPYEWLKPRKIFVGSMTDIFFHSQSKEGRGDVVELFNVMERCPQHTFQILTKRPAEMLLFMAYYGKTLPNVWLGVTICNQEEADFKIPILLSIPAVCRYISIEPMLGPIDLCRLSNLRFLGNEVINSLRGLKYWKDIDTNRYDSHYNRLDWVIVGGETGPKSRRMEPGWVARIWRDCQNNDVPFFFKSWGSSYNTRAISGLEDINLIGNMPYHRFKEFPKLTNK